MKNYIGTKKVKAEEMTLGDFYIKTNRSPFGDKIVEHEETEPGYFITYKDGYESWSPKDVFEESYKEVIVNNTTFIERLQVEQVELEEKLMKLCSFLDSDLSKNIEKVQFDLLVKQKNAMIEYNNILKDRIHLLGI